MGMVVEFPADATQRRPAAIDMSRHEGMATVVILPVIRIERYDDNAFGGSGSDQRSPPRRRRRRRARS
jgi:hypothetical protein